MLWAVVKNAPVVCYFLMAKPSLKLRGFSANRPVESNSLEKYMFATQKIYEKKAQQAAEKRKKSQLKQKVIQFSKKGLEDNIAAMLKAADELRKKLKIFIS